MWFRWMSLDKTAKYTGLGAQYSAVHRRILGGGAHADPFFLQT